jgi:hypothetical protein
MQENHAFFYQGGFAKHISHYTYSQDINQIEVLFITGGKACQNKSTMSRAQN